MPHVRLVVDSTPVADCLAGISAEFPDAEFRILAAQPRERGLLEIVEITTPNGEALAQHFDIDPLVRSSSVIHLDENTLLIQCIVPVSDTYEALISSGNIPRYPVRLRNGRFFKEIVAHQAQLSAYTAALSAADIPYEIRSLAQSDESNDVLTDRQWQFLTEAVERGYYNVPRECTLTDVAEALDISNSAASKLHHRVESQVINAFVTEAGL